ncbi:MAG: hypothetical protein AAF628_13970 [Planctomycetota bacterium]
MTKVRGGSAVLVGMMRVDAVVVVVLSLSCALAAQAPSGVPERPALPVREVTVFKDGHAFAVRRGRLPTDADGSAALDDLPRPVLGTFWPYSADARARLRAVSVGRTKITRSRPALGLRELLEANPAAQVIVTEVDRTYSAEIVGLPSRPGDGVELRTQGDVVLLRTADGVRVVPLNRIVDVTFKDELAHVLPVEEVGERLRLHFDWRGAAPAAEVDVGLMYLQKGLRWIPSYRVRLDGDGKAKLELQATLINELADLVDARVNLVIGVPTFAFADTLDPVALQEAAAALSPYFDSAAQTAHALSNAIMTQTARMTEVRRRPASATPSASAAAGEALSQRAEDLFVYHVEGVTLRRGERMVLPVAELEMSYRDVHRLEVPIAPPVELWQHVNDSRAADVAALLHGPKVVHAIRLQNDSAVPLTTAPALLMLGDQILSQAMMTYTAVGGAVDLDVTTAVDVQVRKVDEEKSREPNAIRWRGKDYLRIDLAGRLELTSYADEAIELEVVRHVLGNVDGAPDGDAVRRHALEAFDRSTVGGRPEWWSWYRWPWWWHHFNGLSTVTWRTRLEPGATATFTCAWHYFWR